MTSIRRWTWKLSARYQFTDNFALRGTRQHRLPHADGRPASHAQRHHDGPIPPANLIPSGTYPVRPPRSRSLWRQSRSTTETSRSFTLGVVWDPLDNVSVNARLLPPACIRTALGLISKTVDQATVDALTVAGLPERGPAARQQRAASSATTFDLRHQAASTS
jgi:iron complex outermembrane receptor protein